MGQGKTTLIAKSSDGLNFTLTGTTWDAGGIPGAYVDTNNLVHLYGCGMGGIVTQTSSDGITFDSAASATAALQTQPSSTTPEIICDPSPVLLDNGTVLLVYKKAPGNVMPSTELAPLDHSLNKAQ